MKPSIERKLESLEERRQELEALLSDSDIISDANRFRELSREYAQLTPLTSAFAAYRQAVSDRQAAEEMLK